MMAKKQYCVPCCTQSPCNMKSKPCCRPYCKQQCCPPRCPRPPSCCKTQCCPPPTCPVCVYPAQCCSPQCCTPQCCSPQCCSPQCCPPQCYPPQCCVSPCCSPQCCPPPRRCGSSMSCCPPCKPCCGSCCSPPCNKYCMPCNPIPCASPRIESLAKPKVRDICHTKRQYGHLFSDARKQLLDRRICESMCNDYNRECCLSAARNCCTYRPIEVCCMPGGCCNGVDYRSSKCVKCRCPKYYPPQCCCDDCVKQWRAWRKECFLNTACGCCACPYYTSSPCT